MVPGAAVIPHSIAYIKQEFNSLLPVQGLQRPQQPRFLARPQFTLKILERLTAGCIDGLMPMHGIME